LSWQGNQGVVRSDPKVAPQKIPQIDTARAKKDRFRMETKQIGGLFMGWIEASTEEGVRVLKLNRGVTNPLNAELVEELGRHFLDVKESKTITSLLITSANEKFFSLGFDIPELYLKDSHEFEAFFTAFNHLCLDLYTLPKPTIAALRGHTIAGGFILASCCDYRFLSQGKKFCALNEINLGVPVPYLSDCILRQLVGDRQATEMMYFGNMIPAEEALRIGIVDALLPPDQVLSESIAKARALGRLPPEAFGAIKGNRTRMVAKEIHRRLDEDIQLFIKFWFNEETRERLKAAMKKF
jgi:3,2-trans-enoyl-CoA isomerase